jgi:hypothetical protein
MTSLRIEAKRKMQPRIPGDRCRHSPLSGFARDTSKPKRKEMGAKFINYTPLFFDFSIFFLASCPTTPSPFF